MALTQTDLDNLDTAIATGELRVESQGRSITYRSVEELLKARAHVSAALAASATAGGGKRIGNFRMNFTTSRGD